MAPTKISTGAATLSHNLGEEFPGKKCHREQLHCPLARFFQTFLQTNSLCGWGGTHYLAVQETGRKNRERRRKWPHGPVAVRLWAVFFCPKVWETSMPVLTPSLMTKLGTPPQDWENVSHWHEASPQLKSHKSQEKRMREARETAKERSLVPSLPPPPSSSSVSEVSNSLCHAANQSLSEVILCTVNVGYSDNLSKSKSMTLLTGLHNQPLRI